MTEVSGEGFEADETLVSWFAIFSLLYPKFCSAKKKQGTSIHPPSKYWTRFNVDHALEGFFCNKCFFLEPFRHVESSRNAIWEENNLLEPSPHCPRDYSSPFVWLCSSRWRTSYNFLLFVFWSKWFDLCEVSHVGGSNDGGVYNRSS